MFFDQPNEEYLVAIHHEQASLPCELIVNHIGKFLDAYDLLFGVLPAFERSCVAKSKFKPLSEEESKKKYNLWCLKPLSTSELKERYSIFCMYMAFPILRIVVVHGRIPQVYLNSECKRLLREVDPKELAQNTDVNLEYFLPQLTNRICQFEVIEFSQCAHMNAVRLWLNLMKRSIYKWRSQTFTITDLPTYCIPIDTLGSIGVSNIRWNIYLSVHEEIDWSSLESNDPSVMVLPGRLCDSRTLMKLKPSQQTLVQLKFPKAMMARKLESFINQGLSPHDRNYVSVSIQQLPVLVKSFFNNNLAALQQICSGSSKKNSSVDSRLQYPYLMNEWVQIRGNLTVLQAQSFIKLYVIDVQDFDILETTREKQEISLNGDTILKNLQQFMVDPEKLCSSGMASLIHCRDATVLHVDKRDNKRLRYQVETVDSQLQVRKTFWERVKGLFEDVNTAEVLESHPNLINIYHVHPKICSDYNIKWPSVIGRVRPIKYLIKPGDSIQFKGRLLNSNNIFAYEIRLNTPSLFICTPYELLNHGLYKGSFLSISLYLTYRILYVDYLEAVKESQKEGGSVMTLSQYLAYTMTIEMLKFQIGMIIYYMFVNWPSKMLKAISSSIGFNKLPGGDKVVNRLLENISGVTLLLFLVESRRTDSYMHKASATYIMGYLTWLAKWYLLFFGYKKGYEALPFLYQSGSRVFGYVRQKVYQVRRFFIDRWFN